MSVPLDREFPTPQGGIRWAALGAGEPVVLVHGTPYSSYLWRDIAPALALGRRVFVFDHLGFGRSAKEPGQDLGLAAHGRRFAELLDHWGLTRPSVVAHDIGGAIALRTLLLEGVPFRDLVLFDAVSGGSWERGLFRLILRHADVFAELPDYAHRALIASHLRRATHVGFRPGALEEHLAPWLGPDGQAAFYRQYRQIREADTEPFVPLLGGIDIPTRVVWGREDRILPPPYGEWLRQRVPGAELAWVEGAGHLLQEDAPGRLLAHLTRPFPG